MDVWGLSRTQAWTLLWNSSVGGLKIYRSPAVANSELQVATRHLPSKAVMAASGKQEVWLRICLAQYLLALRCSPFWWLAVMAPNLFAAIFLEMLFLQDNM